MLPNEAFDFEWVSSSQLFEALLTVILAALAAVGMVFWLTPKVNEWGAFKHIALATTQDRAQGFTASVYPENLVGKIGSVHSRLRPSGKIELEGEIYDAYSRGEFLEQGESIEVISTEGTSLRVKKWEG
jgi:membrane-bound serine protease (ClpP class)